MSSASMIVVDLPAGERVDEELLAGLDGPVLVCHGVTGEACHTSDGRCGLSNHSHGVVFEVDLENPAHISVLLGYREHIGVGVPIRVLVSREQAERFSSHLEGFELWTEGPFSTRPRRSAR